MRTMKEKSNEHNFYLELIRGILISLTIFCISTPIGIAVAMGILETLASGSHITMALVSG